LVAIVFSVIFCGCEDKGIDVDASKQSEEIAPVPEFSVSDNLMSKMEKAVADQNAIDKEKVDAIKVEHQGIRRRIDENIVVATENVTKILNFFGGNAVAGEYLELQPDEELIISQGGDYSILVCRSTSRRGSISFYLIVSAGSVCEYLRKAEDIEEELVSGWNYSSGSEDRILILSKLSQITEEILEQAILKVMAKE